MNEQEVQNQIRKIKRQNTIIFTVFVVIAACLLLWFCAYRYQHTFTVEKWNTDIEIRSNIVDSLLEQYQLVGMYEADVIALLGQEDSEQSSFKLSREEFPPDTTLVYSLGVQWMDNEWLILLLEDGIVSDVRIDVT